jgi:hypothetical protein
MAAARPLQLASGPEWKPVILSNPSYSLVATLVLLPDQLRQRIREALFKTGLPRSLLGFGKLVGFSVGFWHSFADDHSNWSSGVRGVLPTASLRRRLSANVLVASTFSTLQLRL